MGAPPCRGVCLRPEHGGTTTGWFRLGYKRCGQCSVYFRTESVLCPCCHNRLRSKPTGAKSRRREIDRLVEAGEITLY